MPANLRPLSQVSAIILPATGSTDDVVAGLSFAIEQYVNDPTFISGAADQVAYVYKRLGGDVLDLEITADDVYAAYESAVLEYSTLVNMHQARNVLSDLLGSPTGTFDHDGELRSGDPLSASLASPISGASSTSVSLRYPEFSLSSIRDVAVSISQEANVGGRRPVYSASVDVIPGQQDYNLQAIVSQQSADGSSSLGPVPFAGKVSSDSQITVRRVFYKTPRAMWRFYGYYGGLNSVGNLSTYGQYADDSTFEVIPAWQNKLQAMTYEDHIWTRISHYSYEIRNNQIRFFPIPSTNELQQMWFEFTIDGVGDNVGLAPNVIDGVGTTSVEKRVTGVNNANTLPFTNIPYKNINAIGKHWIRRFALAEAKETLGQVRSKLDAIPIPGESVTLNGPALISEAKEEKQALKEELMDLLENTTYTNLSEQRSALVENAGKVLQQIPSAVFVG